MRTIWKYPVPITDRFEVEMPAGSVVVSVDVQGGLPQMWALVDPDAPKEPRRFGVYGTGHPVPEEMYLRGRFVGTFQMHEGALVFHLGEFRPVTIEKATA